MKRVCFCLYWACVDKLAENSLLWLVFCNLPKFNKNSVFLHILLNVASTD